MLWSLTSWQLKNLKTAILNCWTVQSVVSFRWGPHRKCDFVISKCHLFSGQLKSAECMNFIFYIQKAKRKVYHEMDIKTWKRAWCVSLTYWFFLRPASYEYYWVWGYVFLMINQKINCLKNKIYWWHENKF